jgi:hypothetical protein
MVLPGCESAEEIERDAERDAARLEQVELALAYALGDITALDKLRKSHKWGIIDSLVDRNSSTLREQVTCWMVSRDLVGDRTKHGDDAVNVRTKQRVEVKPISINEGVKVKRGANFCDCTIKKLDGMKNHSVIHAAYDHRGQVIFVVEFPMMVIDGLLRKQVKDAEDKHKKRCVAYFSWTNYDDDRLIVHLLITDAQRHLSKNHYRMLRARQK